MEETHDRNGQNSVSVNLIHHSKIVSYESFEGWIALVSVFDWYIEFQVRCKVQSECIETRRKTFDCVLYDVVDCRVLRYSASVAEADTNLLLLFLPLHTELSYEFSIRVDMTNEKSTYIFVISQSHILSIICKHCCPILRWKTRATEENGQKIFHFFTERVFPQSMFSLALILLRYEIFIFLAILTLSRLDILSVPSLDWGNMVGRTYLKSLFPVNWITMTLIVP